MISDWLSWKLSDQYCSEPTAASASLLYDNLNADWYWDLVDELEFSREIMPELKATGSILGPLNEDASRDLGLTDHSPEVVLIGADSHLGALAANSGSKDSIAIIHGTTSPMMAYIDSPSFDVETNVLLSPSSLPNSFLVESNAGSTGKIVEWLVKLLGYDFPSFNRCANESPIGSRGVLTLLGPQIYDPDNLMVLRPGILKFPSPMLPGPPIGRNDISRACLENIAFALAGNLHQVQKATSRNFKSAIATGGLSRLDTGNQILADVLGIPVQKTIEYEGTAVGGAILAYAAIEGVSPEKLWNSWNPLEWVFDPSSENNDAYELLLSNWRELYDDAADM